MDSLLLPASLAERRRLPAHSRSEIDEFNFS
jgi:hypothetical protein